MQQLLSFLQSQYIYESFSRQKYPLLVSAGYSIMEVYHPATFVTTILMFIAGLAASLGYGAASEMLRRSTQSSEGQSSSVVMTEANIKRLVAKLTQMRGAALKLGQFMSIQGLKSSPFIS